MHQDNRDDSRRRTGDEDAALKVGVAVEQRGRQERARRVQLNDALTAASQLEAGGQRALLPRLLQLLDAQCVRLPRVLRKGLHT